LCTGGEDNQAAFEFYDFGLLERCDLTLEIVHKASAVDKIAVEVFIEGIYRRLGLLKTVENGPTTQVFPLYEYDPCFKSFPIELSENQAPFEIDTNLPPEENFLLKETVDKGNLGPRGHENSAVIEVDKDRLNINFSSAAIQTDCSSLESSLKIALSDKIETTEAEDKLSNHNYRDFVRIIITKDRFASKFTEIVSIDIRGPNGYQTVFGFGDSFTLAVVVDVLQKVESAYFTLTLYTVDGVAVYSGYWLIGRNLCRSSFSFEIIFNNPSLRQGEYVFSFAILDDFYANYPLFLSEWNRTHYLKINENYFGTIGLGLVELLTSPHCGTSVMPVPK
jgi:hypothetical protein